MEIADQIDADRGSFDSRRRIDADEIENVIESILFVSGEPVMLARIAAVLGISEFDADAAANRMRDRYSFERRGIRLVKTEGAVQLCSSPEYADYIRTTLEKRKPPQLSQPALEVLAVIAYFQPVTKAYIEQIRGVDSAYTVSLLLDREFIEPCGRLAAPGRPILYKTTSAFLRTFGLDSIRELPELPQIEKADDGRESIHNAILELQMNQNEALINTADENPARLITADQNPAAQNEAIQNTADQSTTNQKETAQDADVNRETGVEDMRT